jgi:putative salt-induced outer membrane protein YdiY
MGIETKITETITFKVSFENRYESNPAEGKEKNDLKLITGLSYKF